MIENFTLYNEGRDTKFLGEHRVTFKVLNGSKVVIEKIEIYSDRFEAWTDLTVRVLIQQKAVSQLIDEIYDWYIGFKFEEMNKPKEYEYENEIA